MKKLLILCAMIFASSQSYGYYISLESDLYGRDCSGMVFKTCNEYRLISYIYKNNEVNMQEYFNYKLDNGDIRYNNGICTIINSPFVEDEDLGLISMGANYIFSDEFWGEDNKGNVKKIKPNIIKARCSD